MRKTLLPLLMCALAWLPQDVQAMAGKLDRPGIACPEDYPKASHEQVRAVLSRPDCEFLGGNWINWMTTLRYAGGTKALNLFLDELVKCERVTLSVSFEKALPGDGDWHVHHNAHSFRFHVRISLASENVRLDELVIPDIRHTTPAASKSERASAEPDTE